MASTFVVCVLFALAAHGAVINTQDMLLRRIVRSPSCDKCSEHHPQPLPPPPFRRGPPPPGFHSGSSTTSQDGSIKEAEFSRNQHVGEFQRNAFNSGSGTSAQAVNGQFDTLARKNGFSGNRQVEGGFQQNGFNAGSSAQAVSVSNGHGSKIGMPGSHQNLGNGFHRKGFNVGSSASAQAVSGIDGFDKHGPKYGFPGNHENLGSGSQKNGFNSGSAASAQTIRGVGSNDKFAHEEEFSGKQQAFGFQQNGQAVGGAFSNLNQVSGVRPADKQGCSSCAKGGSAVSNAKSRSGSATAIAVNNG